MNVQDVLDLVEIIHKTKDLGPEFKPVTDLAFYELRGLTQDAKEELEAKQEEDRKAADAEKDKQPATPPDVPVYTPSPKALDSNFNEVPAVERRI